MVRTNGRPGNSPTRNAEANGAETIPRLTVRWRYKGTKRNP